MFKVSEYIKNFLAGNVPGHVFDMIVTNSLAMLGGAITWYITGNIALTLLVLVLVYAIIVTVLYTYYAGLMDAEAIRLEATLTSDDDVLITLEHDSAEYTKLVKVSELDSTVEKLVGTHSTVTNIVGYRRLEITNSEAKQNLMNDIQREIDKE